MTRRFPLRLIVCLVVAPAFAESPQDRWNLADLYPSAAAWSSDATKLEAQTRSFAACRGHLGDNVKRFRQCLDLQADMNQRFARLYVYAAEQYAADTGVAAHLELTQKAALLESQLDEANAFVNPELLRLGKARVARFLAADKSLAKYRHPLDEVLRAAPHTLSAPEEALVSRFSLMNGAGNSAYTILTNADLPWPTVTLSTGENVRLDDSGYVKYRQSPDAGDRKRVMDAFWGAHKTYERTFGVMLYSKLKEDAVLAKVRKYPDSITRSLDGDHVPVAVIDTLIAQTNASLPTLHRYFRLRARLLGVAPLQYSDIYPPLVHSDRRFPLAEAERLVLETVAPLGADYVATLKQGFEQRWMDAYPRPNKQSGAHMAGYAYGVHPFVLMNYSDDYESLTTLAHEWGHAMHTVLADRAQPFVTSNYATFIAEIASTFNEELLLDHMLATATSDDERLLYLGSALEGLRGTFYRQAMFAEFERKMHAQVDAGEPVSGEGLSKSYCELLDRYHGTAQGVMSISRDYCVEWAYIPHFYNPFYVYQYATSIAASSLFARQVSWGEAGALERFVALLSAGGNGSPYELVKAAGVDLATPAPYQAIAARMNQIMDEIEAILARR
jgi:oligoendopeptidase F